jgi:hypothetical protein
MALNFTTEPRCFTSESRGGATFVEFHVEPHRRCGFPLGQLCHYTLDTNLTGGEGAPPARFGLRLKIWCPAHVNLALTKIDLFPHQQIGLLAAQGRPKTQEEREVLLWVLGTQFALGARKQPLRVNLRVVPLWTGIFQLHALERIRRKLHLEHPEHFGGE